MANYKARRQKFGIGSLLFLMLFGAIFTGVGVFALISNKVDPSWTRVTGEVVDSSSHRNDGSTTYSPIVQYEVNGQSYRVASSISSSSYPRIGEKREIAYNPVRPDQSKVVQSASTQWIIYLFPMVGVACLAIAPYAFIRSARRSNNINQLMQSGQKLQGILVDIRPDGSNNNSGYKIVVAATDPSGAVQNYTSDSLTGIGGLAVADFRNTPIPIDVYIDPLRPQDYYVDVADIPNLTPQRIGELIKSATQNKQVTPLAHRGPSTPPINPTPPPSQT
ncbi:DUF3592 domain-containing protein [Candidatus Saccharibacteria bacterium]|nr:MAG: DUF3592 domain-containing protein [Candidatus Saccharibacteria bacterium]